LKIKGLPMATNVTFLGYTLPIGANGKIEEPTDSDVVFGPGGWNVTFLDAEEILQINLGAFVGPHNSHLRFVADVKCVEANGVWTPSAIAIGFLHQTPNFWLVPNGVMSLHIVDARLGVLEFESDDLQAVGVRDGNIVFQNVRHTWKVDPGSPLALVGTSVPIDFKKGVVHVGDGAFELLTSNIWGPKRRQTTCFSRSHVSAGKADISLATPPSSLKVTFKPKTNKPLPLHVDLLDRSKKVVDSSNPMIPALSIADYLVDVELVRSGKSTISRALTARSAGANLSLSTHFLSDRTNVPRSWRSNAALSLGVRAGDTVRPGSLFVISPNAVLQPSGAGASIHGVAPDAQFAFQGAAEFVLDTGSEPKQNPNPEGFDPPITREVTYPYLRWANLPAMATKPFTLMHAGRSTLPDATQTIEGVNLSGSTLILPISDRARLVQTGQSGQDHLRYVDSLLGAPSYPLTKTTHDSGRLKLPPNGGSTMALSALFSPEKPVYQQYTVVYQLGDRFALEYQDDGTAHDFIVLGAKAKFTQCRLAGLLGQNSPFDITRVNLPVSGILKLSRGMTLEAICRDPRVNIKPPFASNDPINSPNWVGLLILNLSATTVTSDALYALFGNETLTMPYLAVTAQDGTNAFDFTGCLEYDNNAILPTPTSEANFRISKVSAFWQNSSLQKLDIDGTLNVARCLGLALSPPQQIKIAGRYDTKTKSVRFASRFVPLQLLPNTVQGAPIGALQIDAVDVTFGNGRPGIVASGSIKVDGFTLGSFALDGPGGAVDFTNLTFPFDVTPGLSAIDIDIGYPNLQLNRDNISFTWGSFQIALTGIGMISDLKTWKSIPSLDIGGGGNPPAGPAAAVTLSLSLMKLPALAAKSVDRLTLNILVGMLPAGNNWDRNFWARIQAVDFKDLELDLMQFLTIKIHELKMSQDIHTKVFEFGANGVEVSVLNEKVATVTVRIFNRDGESGFLAFLAPKKKIESWFDVDWLLAAQNITIPDDVATKMITINPGGGLDPDALGDALAGLDLVPSAGRAGNRRWLFGAGIHVATDILSGQAVFQDEGFCGIALYSSLLKKWFNLDFAIGVAYRRGARPEQDTFFVALTVPQVTLPAFDFMGGTISLAIAMNGDFKLDVGFPSLGPDGVARSWERCFGAIVGIFQGSGGFYLTKGTPGALQTTTGLRLGGGYAVQAGFGASFGAGIFSVVVTIGVYAIVEGEFVLEKDDIVEFTLTGAIGVLFRGVGQLDWWVISVSVSIVVAAEARATLHWAAGSKAQIDFDFTVYASASAQACIGGRWFHLCKSISVSIPMRVHYQIPIG
jgi:hypothetical protein